MGKRRDDHRLRILLQRVTRLAGELRAQSFTKALRLAHEREFRSIVETGSYHGDDSQGQSTLIFGYYCKDHPDCMFESVDREPACSLMANTTLKERALPGRCVNQDSIEFLKNIGHPIDLLYLDSYDFEPHNPEPSQTHQLHEVEAAYPHLNPNSVILLDDCGVAHGGKGYSSSIYLLKLGWKIVHDGYQRLLSR